MKKIRSVFMVLLSVALFGACDQSSAVCHCGDGNDCACERQDSGIAGGGNGQDSDNGNGGNNGGGSGDVTGEQRLSLLAHYDYGLCVQNRVTLLLNGSDIFFKISDYGIDEIIAGDVVYITYEGEYQVRETYPGTVVTDNMTIKNITVEEAKILELSVQAIPGGGYDLFFGTSTVRSENDYVVNADGTFETLGDKHLGMTLYGVDLGATSSIGIRALYSYNPRPEQTPISGNTGHTCSLVQLRDIEPTCRNEGLSEIGCTDCGEVYFSDVLPKVDCRIGENGKCIWCDRMLSDFYTWIADLTADDILSMQRDEVMYGVEPGMRVVARETTGAQADKETILTYLKTLALTQVSDEEAATDGGGGVHLTIYTADGQEYALRENNGYFHIDGKYYRPSDEMPDFGEEATIWESCCFCGLYDCSGHEA